MCRRAGQHVRELQNMWFDAAWLGRDSTSDESIVINNRGIVMKIRALKRHVPSQQLDPAVLQWLPRPMWEIPSTLELYK